MHIHVFFLKDAAKAKEHLNLFNKACKVSILAGIASYEKKLVELVDRLAEER